MPKPRILILRAPGTNCDGELQFAFEQAGGLTERIHINRLRENPAILNQYQVLAIAGGFTYGDDIAAGKIFAVQLSHFLADAVRAFRDQEKLILGVCNGFQILLKAGIILQPDEDGPLATLAFNESGKFEDRWVNLTVQPNSCPFLEGYESMFVPVAHAEGNFVVREEWMLDGLRQSKQIVLTYSSGEYPKNPNGSQGNVAGLCDPTGRVLGLMPHPERHIMPTQHPRWTRDGLAKEADGLKLFRNAVEFFQE